MYINLRCSNCGEVGSPASYNTLFRIWKYVYDKVPDDKKHEAYLTAESRCLCGHTEHFDTPMFKYTFGVMFEEISSLLSAD